MDITKLSPEDFEHLLYDIAGHVFHAEWEESPSIMKKVIDEKEIPLTQVEAVIHEYEMKFDDVTLGNKVRVLYGFPEVPWQSYENWDEPIDDDESPRPEVRI